MKWRFWRSKNDSLIDDLMREDVEQRLDDAEERLTRLEAEVRLLTGRKRGGQAA